MSRKPGQVQTCAELKRSAEKGQTSPSASKEPCGPRVERTSRVYPRGPGDDQKLTPTFRVFSHNGLSEEDLLVGVNLGRYPPASVDDSSLRLPPSRSGCTNASLSASVNV